MFGKLFKRRGEDIAAATLYTKCLKQARLPGFYGEGKVADTYDGRIDLLTLHMTLIMAAARKFGKDGTQLNQAMYDIMVQDFNIAMREEGIADTGISRRIKPMISLFLVRTKAYTDALLGEADLETVLKETLLDEADSDFTAAVTAYAKETFAQIQTLDLPVLNSGQVSFAPFQG